MVMVVVACESKENVSGSEDVALLLEGIGIFKAVVVNIVFIIISNAFKLSNNLNNWRYYDIELIEPEESSHARQNGTNRIAAERQRARRAIR